METSVGGVPYPAALSPGPEKPSNLPSLTVPVAVDTEGSGLFPDDGARISIVSVAWYEGERVVSCAFPFDQGMRDKFPQMQLPFERDVNLPESEWLALMRWLSRHRLGFWNAVYDLLMLWTGTRHFPGVDLRASFAWDAYMGSRILDPTNSAALGDASSRLSLWGGGELESKELIKRAAGNVPGGRYDLIPWEIMEPYAAGDADLTIRHVYQQMDRIEAGEGSLHHLRREFQLSRTLVGLEHRGFPFDAVGAKLADRKLDLWERETVRTLPFNPSLESARRWFWQKAADIMNETTTAGGKPTIDAQKIARLVEANVPYAEEFALIRKIRTARTKWLKPYAEGAGSDRRLRTRFRQGAVVSGRLSSQRVNLQAIPHDYQLGRLTERIPTIRQFFRGQNGKKLWELDLGQAELRIAAKLANCQSMLQLVADGADMHGEVARQLFQCDETQPCWFKHRQIAKRSDFSLIFDVEAETFQSTLYGLTDIWLELDECSRIVHEWRALYPEFHQAVQYWHRVAEQKGWVRLVNGRIRYFAGYEDRHKAFNQLVQGSLAEFMNDWMCEVDKRWPDVLVLTIHDSLVEETAEPEIVELSAALGAELATAMFGVPMIVDVKEWK